MHYSTWMCDIHGTGAPPAGIWMGRLCNRPHSFLMLSWLRTRNDTTRLCDTYSSSTDLRGGNCVLFPLIYFSQWNISFISSPIFNEILFQNKCFIYWILLLLLLLHLRRKLYKIFDENWWQVRRSVIKRGGWTR